MKKNLNKIVIIALAVALLGMTIVAGTLAYLHTQTVTITNTFTAGDGVVIALTETGAVENAQSFDYIPAKQNIAKDPTITVSGRECWVFVGVKVSADIDTYIDYTIDPNIWDTTTEIATLADGTVIYAAKALGNKTSNATLNILKDNKVHYKNVDTLPTEALTMQFTGYAIQTSEAYASAADAWAALDVELGITPPAQD